MMVIPFWRIYTIKNGRFEHSFLPVKSDEGKVEDKQELLDLLNIKSQERSVRKIVLKRDLAIYIGWKN